MKNILITGATGNIGQSMIRSLFSQGTQDHILAGVRNIKKARTIFADFPKLDYVEFDFEAQETFQPALTHIDTVFLLRPPHISDVDKFFKPLIAQLGESHVKQVLFISVQGVEASRVIPHNKIEAQIVASGLDYIFLRPSYFMQNLTTTLRSDIQNRHMVFLPAGNAKFNWVDIENIGEASALLIKKFDEYRNQAIEITGDENENFESVIKLVNEVTRGEIKYIDSNPLWYYVKKRQEGIGRGMIFVMILLHFLPRFQKAPRISAFYQTLTGKKTTTLKQFIEREKDAFEVQKLGR